MRTLLIFFLMLDGSVSATASELAVVYSCYQEMLIKESGEHLESTKYLIRKDIFSLVPTKQLTPFKILVRSQTGLLEAGNLPENMKFQAAQFYPRAMFEDNKILGIVDCYEDSRAYYFVSASDLVFEASESESFYSDLKEDGVCFFGDVKKAKDQLKDYKSLPFKSLKSKDGGLGWEDARDGRQYFVPVCRPEF